MITSVRQQLQEAVTLAKQGNKVEAQARVSDVLQSHPESADAWILMAQLVDDPVRQLECWRKASNLKPDDMRIQANIARLAKAEDEFSPYITPPTAALEYVEPIHPKRKSKSQGGGCLLPFLLLLVALALGAFAYGLYLNRINPGWLGEEIYDRRAFDLMGKLHDTNLLVFDAMPDTTDVFNGSYEPMDSDIIIAMDSYSRNSQQLMNLETPIGRSAVQPYMIQAGQTCAALVPLLQAYMEHPTRTTMSAVIDAIGTCGDVLNVALGHLAVAIGIEP